VLLAAVARELTWSLPTVAREARAWRAVARGIPDAPIRRDALSALAGKRGHTDGAALFTILPRARSRSLLRLLVAYEIAWDFLDSVNEHGAAAGQTNGIQLHRALLDALDPGAPIADHYRHHPWRGDGGYLRALVEICRECCGQLPGYERVRRIVLEEAARAQVLGINHELDPARRDADLRAWAAREFPVDARKLPCTGSRESATASPQLAMGATAPPQLATGADAPPELPVGAEATWFELTGAASASLTIHALLALAAEPPEAEDEIERVRRAYFPWISAATTMLDSYVDQQQDAASGDHSYVAHYPSPKLGLLRIRQLVERCLREACALPDGERHTLIAACMAAMYLSKDSARAPEMRASTESLADAGGPLTRLLLPVLRLWRIAYAQRST
jgi:tetraprenyl-beta-curcumene synthase